MERDCRRNYGFQLSEERVEGLLFSVMCFYMGPKKHELISMLLGMQSLTRNCQMYKELKKHQKFAQTKNQLNEITNQFITFTREYADEFMSAVVTSKILHEETARKFMAIQ
jgi:hypothetical protein